MPNLPEIVVSQPVSDRIMATFKNDQAPDGTLLTPTQAYQQWVKRMLRERLLASEVSSLEVELEKIRKERLANLNGLEL